VRMATSGVTSAIGQVIHPEAPDSDHEKSLLVSAPQPSRDRPLVNAVRLPNTQFIRPSGQRKLALLANGGLISNA